MEINPSFEFSLLSFSIMSLSVSSSSLSFCMIAKNEQENLPRCLASVQPYIDEMIVVDTGSEDHTVESARAYGARVAFFSWCNDFAAARNYAISQASCDWILMLDADEELQVASKQWRSSIAQDSQIIAHWLFLRDLHLNITPLRTPRLFRRIEGLGYTGCYHEQLTYHQQAIAASAIQELPEVTILHHGYAQEQLWHKRLHRDIPLLEARQQQETLTLHLLTTLADAYLQTDQLEKAQHCWQQALERLFPHLLSGQLPPETTRLPALLFSIGANLLYEQNDYETLLLITRRGLEWFPDYPPLLHLSGLLLKELGFSLGAAAYFQQCLHLGKSGNYFRREPFDFHFMTTLPARDLGLLYQELNDVPKAREAFQQVLAFDPHDSLAREYLGWLT